MVSEQALRTGINRSLVVGNPVSPVQPMIAGLHQSIAEIIRGKQEVIHQLLVAFAAGGSILLEDVPGVGKTTLAKAFTRLVDVKFERIQCTPDLLPSDIYGFSVYNSVNGEFEFRPGPIFCNVLLVDEINRASPRTQSALLEAMAERQVTVDGTCRSLDAPFLVIATQNPLGFHGTYPLPEAQLDRFLFCLSMDYPSHDDEVDMLYGTAESGLERLEPVLRREQLDQIFAQVREVEVHRDLASYMVQLVNATRDREFAIAGCSPRGTQMLFRASQANAFVLGRNSVLPDDIKYVAPLVLAHRILTRRGERTRHSDKRPLIEELLEKVAVPV